MRQSRDTWAASVLEGGLLPLFGSRREGRGEDGETAWKDLWYPLDAIAAELKNANFLVLHWFKSE